MSTARRKRIKGDRERSKELRRQELQVLQERIENESPDRGYTPPLTQLVAFRALPLSNATLQGLDSAQPQPYTTMTAIQNACIPHALARRDVLGAAKTGSGKTLAYLIPVLETLYRHSFTPLDGPGALVLSPTRELAVQIFQVLKQVGKFHNFSVGLLIGGKKDFFDEQKQITSTNLLICTPGRLLQHCEQTPYLELSSVRILVLDEADRILDMGFREQLVRILAYLPQERQTLLFSATQTRDVSQMATLSLQKPEYLGVHDKEKNSTPEGLQQSYVIVPLKDKLNAVFSFLKSNLKGKSILFFASCAQVRHAFELFCSLRPGIPVLALHGKLAQTRRTQIYFDFLQRPSAVLVATDICARGLDFPNISWVVQVDAPEDRDMYIHRAGRTARYRAGGKALLMLTPEEDSKGFVDLLQRKPSHKRNKPTSSNDDEAASSTQIPLKKLSINPSKTVVVSQRAASLVASDVELQRLAKKAFQSYARSIHLMPHKTVFSVQDLDLDGYASSLGLASTPNLQFMKKVGDRADNRQSKNINRKLQKLKEQIKADKLAKRIAKMGGKLPEASNDPTTGDDEDELLLSKTTTTELTEAEGMDDDEVDVKLYEVSQSRHLKKIRIYGSNSANKRIVFNDDGAEADPKALLEVDEAKGQDAVLQDKKDLARATDDYMQRVRDRLRASSEFDHDEAKQRVRDKPRKRRLEGKSGVGVDVAVAPGITVQLGDDVSYHSAEEENHDDGDDTDIQSEQTSSDSDDVDDEFDTKTQEDMALALIRGTT